MNNNIDWKDVENKISIICYKFDNLSSWHEDLSQELRIHAYYVSDNYYDLYRKAIDFWRKIQSKQSPEVPYFDLDILGQSSKSIEQESMTEFDDLVNLIRKELNRPGHNKWDTESLGISNILLDMIVADIDHRLVGVCNKEIRDDGMNHYINQRLNLSWVAEETGIGYKRIVVAMKSIEDIVRGLFAMKKIEIPKEYFEGYYD